jgi:hypothetical protein
VIRTPWLARPTRIIYAEYVLVTQSVPALAMTPCRAVHV